MIRSRLADVLKEKGMRVTRVIDTSGLARETVFRAKKDSTIASCTLATLESIARALDVSVKDLFDEIRDDLFHENQKDLPDEI